MSYQQRTESLRASGVVSSGVTECHLTPIQARSELDPRIRVSNLTFSTSARASAPWHGTSADARSRECVWHLHLAAQASLTQLHL